MENSLAAPVKKTPIVLASSLSAAVCLLAIVAWGNDHHWQIIGLSPYSLFPVFGLLAFSTLWSQYVTILLSGLLRWKTNLNAYFETTGFFVLLFILLHPGILVWQLWRDGFGLPPQSYLQHFVAPGLEWVALLGTVSFFIFLSYELRRWFANRGWWKYVGYACDLAMLAVFYHGLVLGDQLHVGWFRIVWLLYGLVLVSALIYIHGGKMLLRSSSSKNQ